MRPWRLLIEVGQQEVPAPPPGFSSPDEPSPPSAAGSADQGKAWATLKDARVKMLEAQGRGDHSTVAQINGWIGGGLALMAEMTGENAASLLAKLAQEVPLAVPAMTTSAGNSLTPNLVMEPGVPQAVPGSNARFYPVKRERPDPPPGAPRALQPEDLTPEERAELGMFLPGEEPPPLPAQKVTVTVTDKKVAKKAPVKKKAVAKKAPAKKSPS